MERSKEIKEQIKACEEREKELDEAITSTIAVIGNIVHDSVPIDDNEDNNRVERTWGSPRAEDGLYNHVDLVQLLDIVSLEEGQDVAGGRGYFLKGAGVLLNQALINCAQHFLYKKGYQLMHTPFFMRKTVMAKCAQLSQVRAVGWVDRSQRLLTAPATRGLAASRALPAPTATSSHPQFDEELYHVTGEGEDKYLIATSEQTLVAYHQSKWFERNQLPIRLAGYSSCFRKEVGSHGRDTLGIFRVHQFEKASGVPSRGFLAVFSSGPPPRARGPPSCTQSMP